MKSRMLSESPGSVPAPRPARGSPPLRLAAPPERPLERRLRRDAALSRLLEAEDLADDAAAETLVQVPREIDRLGERRSSVGLGHVIEQRRLEVREDPDLPPIRRVFRPLGRRCPADARAQGVRGT